MPTRDDGDLTVCSYVLCLLGRFSRDRPIEEEEVVIFLYADAGSQNKNKRK
jgi:hypothetical protein